MKNTVVVLLLSLLLVPAWGGFRQADPPATAEEINWVSIEEAAVLAEKDGKKLLIDLYTEWCGWCKRMDRDTYTDPTVVAYINEHYHAVKFDAEQKESIEVGGITYQYLPNAGRRGIHELAAKMTNGRPSYPSTVFFEADLSIITRVPGYQKPNDLMPILSFLAENAYQNTSWEEYERNYQKSNAPSGK